MGIIELALWLPHLRVTKRDQHKTYLESLQNNTNNNVSQYCQKTFVMELLCLFLCGLWFILFLNANQWKRKRFFSSPNCPEQLWGPPNLLFNG
jgi:hypothetical protein